MPIADVKSALLCDVSRYWVEPVHDPSNDWVYTGYKLKRRRGRYGR